MIKIFLFSILFIYSTSCFFGFNQERHDETPDTSFYDILKLDQKEDATEREIKAAWRKSSRENHPDLKGESTRAQYVKIQRAYEVLGNRKKRKIYDMKGEEAVTKFEERERMGPDAAQQSMDPFAEFFGGGNQREPQKGKDIELMIKVSLVDIYNGTFHSIYLHKSKLCRHCKGSGAASKKHLKKCSKCSGSGVVEQTIQLMPGFVQSVQGQCPKCHGKGKSITKKCPICNGKLTHNHKQKLDIDIERGIPDGHVIVYDMEADQSPDLLPGDVQITIITAPHKVFTRDGNNLKMIMVLTLKEALLGFKKTVKHLDGHTFEVQSTGVTQHGSNKKIIGEGMPKYNIPSEQGNLIVTFEVKFPTLLSEGQKKTIQTLFD